MQDALTLEFDKHSHSHLVLKTFMAEWQAGRQAGMETRSQAATHAGNQAHTQQRTHAGTNARTNVRKRADMHAGMLTRRLVRQSKTCSEFESKAANQSLL